MSEIKVNSIKGVGASAAAITVNNTDGTCTANISSVNNGQFANRNVIINGSALVNQRGNGTSITSSQYIGPDRWKFATGSIGTWSISQETSVVPDGFKSAYKLDCTTANASPASGNFLILRYSVEAQDLQRFAFGTSSAKYMTLSFYVRSTKTGSFLCNLMNPDNSNKEVNNLVTINSADTWERKTINVVGDTSGGFDLDNGEGLRIEFFLNSGTDYTSGSRQSTWTARNNVNRNVGNTLALGAATSDIFYVTGLQLEVGNSTGVATDFEHRSFHEELLRCYRYFNKKNPNYGRIGHMYDGTHIAFTMDLPCEMRASPTITNEGGLYFARYNGLALGLTGINHGSADTTTARISLDVNSNGSSGNNAFIWAGNTFYLLDSEL